MFQDSLTKKIAEAAAKIKTEPEVINVNEKSVEGAVEKIMNEKLHPNQQVLDVHEPEKDKLTAKDFEMLRKKKKETTVKEAKSSLGMSSFGDESKAIEHAKKTGGKVVKRPPLNFTTKTGEKRQLQRYEVHKEETEQIDEVMWPGTPEYKAKYGTDKEKHEARYGKGGEKIEKYGYRGKEAEHGETDWSKETKKEPKKKYGARQNYVRSRKISGKQLKDSFTGLLDMYRDGGLKSLKEMFIKEEPTQDEYTKEVEQVKAKNRGENRNDKNIAAGKVDAVKIVDEDVEELDEAMTRKHFQQVADVIKSHPDQEKRNELAKHHAGIFKASNPRFDHNRFYQAAGANIKEEVEQIDELNKPTLASYAKKATHSARIKQKIAKDFEAGAQRARRPDMKAAGEELSKKYQRKAQKREEGVGKAIDRLAKEEVEQLDELSPETHRSYQKKATKWLNRKGQPKPERGSPEARAVAAKNLGRMNTIEYSKEKEYEGEAKRRMAARKNMKEEVELEERSLTEPEMKKKEEIVKSMKKNMKGFKERYGERGKSVAYATATKIAKEKA